MHNLVIIADVAESPERVAMAESFGVYFDSQKIPYTIDKWSQLTNFMWILDPRVSTAFRDAAIEYNQGLYPAFFLSVGLTEGQIDFARTFLSLYPDKTEQEVLAETGYEILRPENPWG